ncbi:MAG: hypothetical protein AAB649_07355, partial [Patescibacteria group bacterium]
IKMLTNQESILRPAPILAGVFYMFMPYHVAHSLGHFGAMQLEWIPFIAAATLAFIKNPRIYIAGILGILLTIQAWTEHHYIVWIALFGMIAGFVYRKELKVLLSSRPVSRDPDKSTLTWIPGQARNDTALLVLFIILILGIIFPFIPTIRLASSDTSPLELGLTQTIRFSADVFSFITPPAHNPIWGRLFYSLFGQFFTGNNAESVQYVGVSIILALLFFHKHIPVKQKRLWILVILFFGTMSLGPILHIFGKETRILLPYAFIASLPVFSAIRVIARAGVMVSFATAVLFGWVIATNYIRKPAAISIGIVILLEFLFFPFPTQSAKLSPVYDALSGIDGSNIIEIPAATNYTAASRSLYASLLHKKQVLGSIALERGQDEEVNKLVKSIPGIRQLLYLRTTDLAQKRNEFFAQDLGETLPDAMKYLDTRAIIIHTDSLSVLQNSAVMEFLEKDSLFTKQSYEDALLYTLSNTEKRSTDGVFLIRGDGWENIGYDPKRNSVFGEIPEQAFFTIVNTRDTETDMTLLFKIPENSPSGIVIRDNAGSVLQTHGLGEDVLFRVTAAPGETQLSFSHSDTGKVILQNPALKVTVPFDTAQGKPLDATLGKSADL